MNVCSLDSNKVEKGGQEGVKEGEKGGRKDGGTEEGQRGRIVWAGSGWNRSKRVRGRQRKR